MNNPKQLNYTQQLEHRLKMVKDDLNIIKQFISEQGLDEIFNNTASSTSDTALTNIINIEIACDLESDESLAWDLFKNLKN
jgi:hypothetical protein